MSKVALSGNASGTGTFTIASPNSNTDRTLNLPDASGTILTTATPGVPVNGPAFSAFRSGSTQAVSAGTWTKVALNAEIFDTASSFDSTTNYRFTPQTAGYYQVSAVAYLLSGVAFNGYLSIYKDGSSAKYGSTLVSGSGVVGAVCVASGLVYMNGTTDFLEVYVYAGAAVTLDKNSDLTYFDGCLVRSAT